MMTQSEPDWLVCEAHTAAECWSTLAIMIQLTPLVESIWINGIAAFEEASKTAEIKELQVYAPMRVVEIDVINDGVMGEFWDQVVEPIEMGRGWRRISDTQARTLLQHFKEVHLDFSGSHLKFWPPVNCLARVRACTSAKHVDEDIFVHEDLHEELLKAFNPQSTP